jgi:hypothetical protein
MPTRFIIIQYAECIYFNQEILCLTSVLILFVLSQVGGGKEHKIFAHIKALAKERFTPDLGTVLSIPYVGLQLGLGLIFHKTSPTQMYCPGRSG